MTEASSPKLPAVFGRYLLLRRLSQGGMGEIYLARLGEIQGFEKPIVIKKILPQLAQDAEFLRRFIAEAKIAIKLTHGNIVPVYEVGMVDGEYFLAMQYIEGRDLRRVLERCLTRRRYLPPDLCLYIAREVANGLAYAHRRQDEQGQPLNLVHCDISPPNVLLSFEGEVKVIDFGIAKSAMQRAQAADEIAFGKVGYMAPEQLLRGAEVDRRADIYSTGILLHEMLTGQRAYRFGPDVDFREIARVVTAGNLPPPSARHIPLTDRYDQLVMRALRISPAERYQSAEELRDEVQQHLVQLNPTISTDQLASFMTELFAEELKAEGNMLRSLGQTPLESFFHELSDGTSHTVSYALAAPLTAESADLLLGRSPSVPEASVPEASVPGASVPEASVPEASVPGASVPGASVPEASVPGATRRLSGAEKAAVLAASEPHMRAARSSWRRLAMPVAVTLIGAAMLGAGAAMLWGQEEERANTAGLQADSGASQSPLATALVDDDGAPDREGGAPSAKDASAADHEGTTQLRFPPQTVHRTKRHHRPRRRVKRRPATPSAAEVQRKFRRVNREYQTFVKSYGRVLERQWQEIMFANTYSKGDEKKYIRLNQMMDNLRARMRQVRQEK